MRPASGRAAVAAAHAPAEEVFAALATEETVRVARREIIAIEAAAAILAAPAERAPAEDLALIGRDETELGRTRVVRVVGATRDEQQGQQRATEVAHGERSFRTPKRAGNSSVQSSYTEIKLASSGSDNFYFGSPVAFTSWANGR